MIIFRFILHYFNFHVLQSLLSSSLKHKSTKKKRKVHRKEKNSADSLSNNVGKMDIDSDAKMEVE